MPDPVAPAREQLEFLVQLAPPGQFATTSRRPRNPRSGGILSPKDLKANWVVNIRPKNWGDRDKIWFGKIKTERKAQLTSDIVHHYLGLESVHSLFPEQNRIPPQFFNKNLQGLQTQAKRLQYVKFIAKGEEHQSRRRELMASVKEMVEFLTAGNEAAAAEPWPFQPVPEYAIHGEYRLSRDIPTLQQEDIDTMLSMALHGAL